MTIYKKKDFYSEISRIVKEEIVNFDEKTVLTEQLLVSTKNILSEGGNAFDDVTDVPIEKADKIFKEYLALIKTTGIVDVNKVVGIGSSRKLLHKLPGAKPFGGDIDLLGLISKNVATIKDATTKLKSFFESEGIQAKSFFGNIVSVSFPSKAYPESNVQIDLMLAEPSLNDRAFKYLRDLRFFSDEDYEKDAKFVLKGTHRTELIRFLIKAVGLGLGTSGLYTYKWNNQYNDIKELFADIEAKIKRTRKQDTKDELTKFASFFVKYKTFNSIEDLLVNKETGFIKNRYLIDDFSDSSVIDMIVSLLFERVELSIDKDWEDIIKQAFDESGSLNLLKFSDVLNFIVKQKQKNKISDKLLILVFKGYKQHLEKSGIWSVAFEDHLFSKLPILKNNI